MPNPLHTTINKLASEFARDLLHALRNAPLDDIHAMTGGKTPSRVTSIPRSDKRVRRSSADVNKMAEQIVAIVAKHANGIRAEVLRRTLGVATGNAGGRVFNQPLAVALQSKKIWRRGQRRGTTYHAK